MEGKYEKYAKIFCIVCGIVATIVLTSVVIITTTNDSNKKLTVENTETEKETTDKKEVINETINVARSNELNVWYITDGKCQYEDGVYTILFGFEDENNDELWINARIDLEIVDDNNEVLYKGFFYITELDYSIWSNAISGDKYLASIEISEDDILEGSTESGKIVLNVTGEEYQFLLFENYEIDAYDLPCKAPSDKCSISIPALPLTVNEYNWRDEIDTTIRIDSIVSEWDDNYDGTCDLKLTFSGEKTYGDNDYSYISYKLYDSEGYVVDSGVFITDKLSSRDKFKNMEERIYNLDPGTYRLEITDYK